MRDLLPRAVPGCFSSAELEEFDRRMWDTSIFDDVAVRADGSVLRVSVREKWTLIPGIDFSSAQTLRDSSLTLSVTEGNLFGRATTLYGAVAWVQRGFNAELYMSESEYIAQRLSFEGGLSYLTSETVFEAGDGWSLDRVGALVGLRPRYQYAAPVRMVWTGKVYHERSQGQLADAAQRSGTFASAGARITWDNYEFHDLIPHGYKIGIELYPGLFFGEARLRARHEFNSDFVVSYPLGGKTVALARLAVDAASPGDPNHAVILGTADGVRGLPDNLFRNAFHAYGNLELRRAFTLSQRLFLQGALFWDVATYAQMDRDGQVQALRGAASFGGGVRLVPTFLADIVPRVDGGFVLFDRKPEAFIRFGASQYF